MSLAMRDPNGALRLNCVATCRLPVIVVWIEWMCLSGQIPMVSRNQRWLGVL